VQHRPPAGNRIGKAEPTYDSVASATMKARHQQRDLHGDEAARCRQQMPHEQARVAGPERSAADA
jgi:hypothetical protein